VGTERNSSNARSLLDDRATFCTAFKGHMFFTPTFSSITCWSQSSPLLPFQPADLPIGLLRSHLFTGGEVDQHKKNGYQHHQFARDCIPLPLHIPVVDFQVACTVRYTYTFASPMQIECFSKVHSILGHL
jgi:hypothetical protein